MIHKREQMTDGNGKVVTVEKCLFMNNATEPLDFASLYSRHKHDCGNFLCDALLDGKMQLSEIPFVLRFDSGVYVSALRTNRWNWKAERDIQIIMQDVLSVSNGIQAFYGITDTEIAAVLNMLFFNIEALQDQYSKTPRELERFNAEVFNPFMNVLQNTGAYQIFLQTSEFSTAKVANERYYVILSENLRYDGKIAGFTMSLTCEKEPQIVTSRIGVVDGAFSYKKTACEQTHGTISEFLDKLIIKDFYIKREEHCGRGFGSILMDALLKYAYTGKANGIWGKYSFIDDTPGNRARRKALYEKFGFSEVHAILNPAATCVSIDKNGIECYVHQTPQLRR